jgi:hypothetical protein
MSEDMDRLPPDLDHVGDRLVSAAERTIVARRHRSFLLARICATGLAALIAAAVLLPGTLDPAVRKHGDLAFVPARHAAVPLGCDQPRGRQAALPACVAGDPLRIGRPRRW